MRSWADAVLRLPAGSMARFVAGLVAGLLAGSSVGELSSSRADLPVDVQKLVPWLYTFSHSPSARIMSLSEAFWNRETSIKVISQVPRSKTKDVNSK